MLLTSTSYFYTECAFQWEMTDIQNAIFLKADQYMLQHRQCMVDPTYTDMFDDRVISQ